MLIMHVEDEDDHAAPIQTIIEAKIANARVLRFVSAEDALNYLAQSGAEKPAIILSDYNLEHHPTDMNGAQFALQLHQQESSIPFILATNKSWDIVINENPELRQSSPELRKPIHGYCGKTDGKKLVALIRQLVAPIIDPISAGSVQSL